jgi:hypothetical protein
MRKTIICTALSATLFLAGCGGRAANPVMVNQFGDQSKSCNALELEMNQMQENIQRLMPKTEKTGKNVALGVTGAFLIVPLFFMDLSQAEQVEVDAFRQRYNTLAIIATDKDCAKVELIPTFEEQAAAAKAAAEKAKAEEEAAKKAAAKK